MDAATLKQVVDSSNQLVTLALGVVGASIAAVIGTSYVRPAKVAHRRIYLLYYPAWICIGLSVYAGETIARKYLAFLMVSDTVAQEIFSDINDLYGAQRAWLSIALTFLFLWLIFYLWNWVYTEDFVPKKKS